MKRLRDIFDVISNNLTHKTNSSMWYYTHYETWDKASDNRDASTYNTEHYGVDQYEI